MANILFKTSSPSTHWKDRAAGWMHWTLRLRCACGVDYLEQVEGSADSITEWAQNSQCPACGDEVWGTTLETAAS